MGRCGSDPEANFQVNVAIHSRLTIAARECKYRQDDSGHAVTVYVLRGSVCGVRSLAHIDPQCFGLDWKPKPDVSPPSQREHGSSMVPTIRFSLDCLRFRAGNLSDRALLAGGFTWLR